MQPLHLLARILRAFLAPEQVLPHLLFEANRIPYSVSRAGYSWPPRRIFLGVNSVCDAHCSMCDYGLRQPGRMFYKNLRPSERALELPLERLKLLVDEVKTYRPIVEAHTVEPTLYRDLPSLAEYAGARGLSFRVFTNGVRLAQMADDLVAADVDQIYVSIDGPQEVHDTIRGKQGSFNHACAGIQAVNEAVRRKPKSRTKIRINATISSLNHRYLVELVEVVKPLQPFCIMFTHLNFVTEEMAARHNRIAGQTCLATPLGIGGSAPLFEVDTKILSQQLTYIQEMLPLQKLVIKPSITSVQELDIYYHHPNRFFRQKLCRMPWQTMMVIPDGSVIVRNRCYNLIFGNIFENSVAEIWNGPSYRAFRVALKKAGAFPACSRCYGVNP